MKSIPLQTSDYSALSQKDRDNEGDDDATLVPDNHGDTGKSHWRLSQLRSIKILPWILHALLIVINLFTFFYLTHSAPQDKQCTKVLSAWSPVIDQGFVQYRTVPVNISLEQKNQFKGAASPEVDAAWANVSTAVPALKLSVADLARLRKSPETAAPAGNGPGSGYRGQLEVYEQLSCLDTLRKAAYRETYPEMQKGQEGFDEVAWHASIDQCIDVLRVELLCKSDVTVLTYLKDGTGPDFTMVKKCRDFDKILNWSTSARDNNRMLP